MEVPLIALVGVLVSVLASFLATSRQLKHEASRAAAEHQHLYLSKLYDRRVETYPGLYSVLSDLAKALRTSWTRADVERATRELVTWDSANALFVSPGTAALLIELRHELWKDDAFEDRVSIVLALIGRLEAALRTELGVFDAFGFHRVETDAA